MYGFQLVTEANRQIIPLAPHCACRQLVLGRDSRRGWAGAKKQLCLSSSPSTAAFKLGSVLHFLHPPQIGLKVVETHGRKLRRWLKQMSGRLFFHHNLETELNLNLSKNGHSGSNLRYLSSGSSPAAASIILLRRM